MASRHVTTLAVFLATTVAVRAPAASDRSTPSAQIAETIQNTEEKANLVAKVAPTIGEEAKPATNPFKVDSGIPCLIVPDAPPENGPVIQGAVRQTTYSQNRMPTQPKEPSQLLAVELVTQDGPESEKKPDYSKRVVEPNKLLLPPVPEGFVKSKSPVPPIRREPQGQMQNAPTNSATPKLMQQEAPLGTTRIAPSMPELAHPSITGETSSLYRPIASIMMDGVNKQNAGETVWAVESVRIDTTPPAVPTPIVAAPTWPTTTISESYSDSDHLGLYWDSGIEVQSLPLSRLLWTVPLASPTEPKSFAKFTNVGDGSTIDTGIGGEIGIVRFAPVCQKDEGVQLDVFAAVLSRFDEQRRLNVLDFRWGLPLTMKKGEWSYKLAYEHTSSHIGDENPNFANIQRVTWAKDEIVVGISRRFWQMLRVYGQAGYAVGASAIMSDDRDRYDVGLEWVPFDFTDWRGAPFAALDVQFRSEHDFDADTTFQLGWMFKPNPDGGSGRIALEAFRGHSPYGQYFRREEDWFGVTFAIDW